MNAQAQTSRWLKNIPRVLFFSTFVAITLLSTFFFADWLYRTGLTPAKWTLIGLFFVLTTGLSFGFCQALYGFILLVFGLKRGPIAQHVKLQETLSQGPIRSKTALLFPVYNEDPKRFFNGIKTTYLALQRSGELDKFSFFILSDSTNPNRWIEEENRWLQLCDELDAHGRITYRHRISNLNQKSGNVSDFCRRWGSHYDYMICFDADSLMSAESMIHLVRVMEAAPHVGIVQTMPGLFGAATLFARLQQFANRIHGEISGAGLNFWQQSEGNYWGHNAIIRLAPFIQSCALPELPGPKPLGGRVLSHDFVEAALMRKAGFEVWLAYDLPDSYEELPPTLLDFVQRDRRWCQGNLQHMWIALFGKIPLFNRIHMLNGIYAYLAAPLWLFFLAISTLAAYSWESSDLTLLIRDGFFPLSPQDLQVHGLIILTFTFGMIFLPKLFTIVRLLTDRELRNRFGGTIKASLSVCIEVFVFSLVAPSMMLFHSAFVFSILTGNKVSWTSQNRSNETHTTWLQALNAHQGQTLVGILWAILAWQINPSLFYWMSPVLLGWILSIPLSVITSHTDIAHWLRSKDYLLTPEEKAPPEIIASLQTIETDSPVEPQPIKELRDDYGLIQVILDPYINALHMDFLPKRSNQNSETKKALQSLGQRLLNEGAPALSNDEKQRILNDPQTVKELHEHIWKIAQDELHGWWRLAMSRYSRQSLFVTEFD